MSSRQPLQTTSQLQLPDISQLEATDPTRQLTQSTSQQNTKVYNDLNMIFNAMPQNSGALYFGDPTVDGTWAIVVSGTGLVIQRRESGSWVTKGGFTP